MQASNIEVEAFHDSRTGSLTYLVYCAGQRECAVIDPLLDFDLSAGRVFHESATTVETRIKALGLQLDLLLETHVHADHMSGAQWFKQRHPGARIGIGAHVTEVQAHFSGVYNCSGGATPCGDDFDLLLHDGDTVSSGALTFEVLRSPGHTPACVSYLLGDRVFVGDTLFMPDFGTARADFPGADAATLYRSIGRILALPPETRVYCGHDYCPGGRALAYESTVAEQRADNKHVHEGISEQDFIEMRQARDATLSTPALMLAALQVNISAGQLPAAEANGQRYLRIPIECEES